MANFTKRTMKVRPRETAPFLPLSAGELAEIQERIGIVFRNPIFLARAFIHRSYLNERPSIGLESNERLEFLGDHVLSFAVGQYLFRSFPEMQEGKLTALEASLVNTKMLGEIAEELKLASFVRMSRGEERTFSDPENKTRNRILGSAFEALICAIYLDRGPGTVELFLEDVLFPKLKEIVERELYLDPKSHLQELVQAKCGITPHYSVFQEEGPAHDKSFMVGVFMGESLLGRGEGRSKSEAESRAAKNALEKEFGVKLHKGLL